MADRLRLGNEVRELKIGQSFSNNKEGSFHTIRYDFKPASVDINKMATVAVGKANDVTVTVPHLDGSGVSQTVFKGPQKPFQKECVLIIDRDTGEITLEKISSTIQVKKTRSESVKPLLPQDRSSQNLSDRPTLTSSRPATPPIGQRQSNKTRVTSGSRRPDRPIQNLVPKHSPLHASPNPNYSSPGHYKSPKRDRELHTSSASSAIESQHNSQSTLASLPLIGVDDFSEPAPPPTISDNGANNGHVDNDRNGDVGEMSDSSSSDSSSDSDSDMDTHTPSVPAQRNGHNGNAPVAPVAKSMTLLNEDLHLSESGSDSD